MDISLTAQDLRSKRVILPRRINIRVAATAANTKEQDHRYLSRSKTGLKFKKGLPDRHCVWIVGDQRESGDEVMTLKGQTGNACIGTYAHVEFGQTQHHLLYKEGLEGTQACCELKITFTKDHKFAYISLASHDGYFLFPESSMVTLKTESKTFPSLVHMVPLRLTSASERCRFEIIEPCISQDIHDIVYKTVPSSITPLPPLVVLETFVNNINSHTDIKETLKYSYSKSKSGTWSDKLGTLYGCKVGISTTVPSLNLRSELSMSSTTEHQWGETRGQQEIMESSTEVTAKAGQQTRVKVMIERSVMEVEFTYKQTVNYNDGTQETYDRVGIYSNLELYRVIVEGNDDLPKPKLLGCRRRVHYSKSALLRFKQKLQVNLKY